MEKYKNTEFDIFPYPDDDYPGKTYFYYKIYTSNSHDILVESEEFFDTMQEACYAAIGHISLLQGGQGC